jgi:hypothetical protein
LEYWSIIWSTGVLGSRSVDTPLTFTHHARFNYNEMKSIMPIDTIFVTIFLVKTYMVQRHGLGFQAKTEYGQSMPRSDYV